MITPSARAIASDPPKAGPDLHESLTVARILKVNHAGEYGAIGIYRGQILVSRLFFPDVVPFLEQTLAHEVRHCTGFRNAMPARRARPCRVMSLWASGGWLLGLLTAMLGRRGIWICTAAVESAVHRHLEDQLSFLQNRDDELYELIAKIQAEELSHLSYAEAHISEPGPWSRLLTGVIFKATDLAIWLSTWGESSQMTRDLAATQRT